MENRLSELWSIFDFLMPGFLYSYRKFRERYELPIVKNQDPEALTALRRMTGPFVLRRLKKDVLRELPGKEERIVYSAASGRQQKLYTASALKLKEALAGGAWSGNGKLEVLSQLMRLRQICCDPALCFEENEKLNETQYTQIAILACEAAILGAVWEAGLAADVSAGLSLGEYGALITSGVLDMETAFRVVRQRGIFMQEAVPTGGAMAAVIGMDGEQIRKICQETEGRVSVANYNCPGQVVITGEDTAVERAGMALKEAGARRVLPLKVSGPFHSPMLEGAGKKLAEVLKTVTVQAPVIPYVTNVTAEYVTEEEAIKELLAKQVASSVLWQQSVERMIADDVDTFVEIGPGKTLTGFLRKIDCSVKGFSIEKPEDLEKVLESRGNR